MGLLSRANAYLQGHVIAGVAVTEEAFPILRYFRRGTKEFEAFHSSPQAASSLPVYEFDLTVEHYRENKATIKKAGHPKPEEQTLLRTLDAVTAAGLSSSIFKLNRYRFPLAAKHDLITSNTHALALAQFSAEQGNPRGKLALASLLTYRHPGVPENLEQATTLAQEIIHALDEYSWIRDDAEHLLDTITLIQSSHFHRVQKNQPK